MPPGRSPTGWPASSARCGRCAWSSRAGAGVASHLVAERGRGARVHGCRLVDRPERAAAAGGAAAVRAQRPGHRHPAGRGSRVIRGPKRKCISRCYNMLLHACLGARFSDAQCGFKAIRRERPQALLPLTEDTGWFFDTEACCCPGRTSRTCAFTGDPSGLGDRRPGLAGGQFMSHGPRRTCAACCGLRPWLSAPRHPQGPPSCAAPRRGGGPGGGARTSPNSRASPSAIDQVASVLPLSRDHDPGGEREAVTQEADQAPDARREIMLLIAHWNHNVHLQKLSWQ